MRMRPRKARAATGTSSQQEHYTVMITDTVFQHQPVQETLPLSDSSSHSEQAHHRLRRQPFQDQHHVYYVYANQVEFKMSQAE